MVGYEATFLEALEPAVENIAKKGIKLVSNAGTVATKELFDLVVTRLDLSTRYHPHIDGKIESVNQWIELYL